MGEKSGRAGLKRNMGLGVLFELLLFLKALMRAMLFAGWADAPAAENGQKQ